MEFEASLRESGDQITGLLDALLPQEESPRGRVVDAMRYSALAGGKRLRPFLVLSSSELFDVPSLAAARTAAAVEMIHCYSLIHDDLPAMDDSDLRRGRPSAHKEFDEATAILAGDGLLTKAFEVLASDEMEVSPAVRTRLISSLAVASGDQGMVGGQMIDILSENTPLGIGEITQLQRLKTGALFEFSCTAGAYLGEGSEKELSALRSYAESLGLAFQIADDLLDVEGTEADLGKPVGQDQDMEKATFVKLMGIEGARQKANELIGHACEALTIFNGRAGNLENVARFVVNRRS